MLPLLVAQGLTAAHVHVPSTRLVHRSHFCSRRALLQWAGGAAAGCCVLPSEARVADLSTPLSALQQQERTIEDLFERATPSVVYISTFVEKTDRVTMNAVEVPAGTGSGFIWDDDGACKLLQLRSATDLAVEAVSLCRRAHSHELPCHQRCERGKGCGGGP